MAASSRRLARQAGLRYTCDQEPGISRRRRGRGFSYAYGAGRRVFSQRQLDRIKSLAIPPAWKDVWICRDPRGHLQATGRDDKGRKQFLYHPKWQEASNLAKFDRLLEFGAALPRIRRQVAGHLRKRKAGREQVLALMVRLLDLTGMRIGNEEYVSENGSHGLTTLQRRHLRLNGSSAEFRFPGKSGQRHVVRVNHQGTLRALKSCLADAGKLFAYPNGDQLHGVDADDVNEYLREISSAGVTAKAFRTWLASAQAVRELFERRNQPGTRERQKTQVEVIKEVAERLGNTPAVCRSAYVDPRLLAAFEEGKFPKLFERFRISKRKWLRPEDQILSHALSGLSRRR